MIGFELRNVNPKNKKTGDCVIRALTTATEQPYEVVRDELFELMKKTGYSMNSKQNYEKYLKQKGWVKHKQPRRPEGTKYKVAEIDEFIAPYERAVISIANHLTATENGKIIDLWDCRRKTILNFYTKGIDTK